MNMRRLKTIAATCMAAFPLLAGTAAGGVEFNSNWPVKGKRVININTVGKGRGARPLR